MTEATGWMAAENGATIGHSGSEGGVIWKDEEHSDGARITLERDTLLRVPFAITCSVYGWLVHTRFFADEPSAAAQYEAMKLTLAEILTLVLAEDTDAANDAVEQFAATYP